MGLENSSNPQSDHRSPNDFEKKRQLILRSIEFQKKTFELFHKYVFHNTLIKFSEMHPFLDGNNINIKDSQEKLNIQLPVCPWNSEQIQKAIDGDQVHVVRGPLKLIKLHEAVLICPDGKFFLIKFNRYTQTMSFLIYTDDYLNP